jgi:long-chain acyl-CoA synthetase
MLDNHLHIQSIGKPMNEHDITVLDLLERSVQRAPSSSVIALRDGAMTYSELAARCRRVAASILSLGRGDTVALFFPMTPEFVISFLGAVFAKKCVLPLNLLLPPDQLKMILDDSGAGCIVAPAELAPKLQPLGLPVVSYTDLLKDASLPNNAPRPAPGDLCALLYTSGTTGKPKGVMLTHRNLATNASSAVDAMRIEAKDRFLACLPTFHSLAITGTMLAPIAAGASLATLPKFDPEAVLMIASALKCNILMMVPSMYRVVTRMQERHPQCMKHLRLAVSGAEPLSDEVREYFHKIFGVELLEGYGQTETSPIVSINTPWANKPGTVGKPIKDVRVRIVEAESLKDMPPEKTGEIWVSGPNVMKGYRNRDEETAKVLAPDGWLRTGDMGELTPDGFIRITGRLREMIKVAGEMVFPAEVEQALSTHPAVAEVSVAGVKDERKGEIIKAFVVLKPGAKATEEELLKHARSSLAAYKVPHAIEFRPDLPKGPTGKVMRRLLVNPTPEGAKKDAPKE